MKEVEESLQSLTEVLKRQECCIKYGESLQLLKKDRELFGRFNEFRRKNMELHMRENTLAQQSALRREYEDLLSLQEVDEFLSWEQEVTKLLRSVYDGIAEEMDLDYSFF